MSSALKFMVFLVAISMIILFIMNRPIENRPPEFGIGQPAILTSELSQAIHFMESEAIIPLEVYDKHLIVVQKFPSKYKEEFVRVYGFAVYDNRRIMQAVYQKEPLRTDNSFRKGFSTYKQIEGYKDIYFSENGHLPLVSDGGCDIISVFYDLKTKKFLENRNLSKKFSTEKPVIIHGFCNGLA